MFRFFMRKPTVTVRVKVCLALLCFALGFGQMLGVLHGIVHAHDAAHFHHGTAHVETHVDDNSLARLFSGHASEHDCRSFDHASYCDAMPTVVALVLPLLLLPFVFLALAGLFVARWHAQFQARGPPFSL